MRKPSYSVAHERENQRRREEEERQQREFMDNHYYESYVPPLIETQPQQPKQETREELMTRMMKYMVDGPPPTIRVIAQFGKSTYDFTVTKPEELEMLRTIMTKFLNSF